MCLEFSTNFKNGIKNKNRTIFDIHPHVVLVNNDNKDEHVDKAQIMLILFLFYLF